MALAQSDVTVAGYIPSREISPDWLVFQMFTIIDYQPFHSVGVSEMSAGQNGKEKKKGNQ